MTITIYGKTYGIQRQSLTRRYCRLKFGGFGGFGTRWCWKGWEFFHKQSQRQ